MRSKGVPRRAWALFAVFGLLLVLPACAEMVDATGPNCASPYCGSIGMHIQMSCNQGSGFNQVCTGTVTLTFNPAPDNITVTAILNASSIQGSAQTRGRTTVEIPISGPTWSCPFVNPSYLLVTSGGQTLKNITFNWDSGSCS
jgi:hypothetical protein